MAFHRFVGCGKGRTKVVFKHKTDAVRCSLIELWLVPLLKMDESRHQWKFKYLGNFFPVVQGQQTTP